MIGFVGTEIIVLWGIQTLLSLKQRFVNSLTSLYSIRSLHDSPSAINQCVWKHNVLGAVNSGHLSLSELYLFLFLLVCCYLNVLCIEVYYVLLLCVINE